METQSIEIDKGLIELCHSKKERWHTLKGFIMDMVLLGIQTKYKDLTTYDTMKTDRQKEKKKEEREVFYTSKVENIINKEKTKNLSYKDFDKEKVIDEELKPCEDLIIKFWKAKKGYRSEQAFNLLIGDYGLLGIKKKYGLQTVKEQLEEGIACKWASITLKKYEMYGRPQKADQEPVTNHPAGRLFKNGRFVDE
jgi:hypothetical protein